MLQLKMIKKEAQCHKILYAMLDNTIKNNLKVKSKVINNDTGTHGLISSLDNKYVNIIWEDQTREKFAYNEVDKYLSIFDSNVANDDAKQQKQHHIKKEKIEIDDSTIEGLINKAISKHIIDESDREIELVTLSSMSKEELEDYRINLNNESDDDVEDVNPEKFTEINSNKNLSEAEKMLLKIRHGGPVIGGFVEDNNDYSNNNINDIDSHESRDLSSIKAATINDRNIENFKTEDTGLSSYLDSLYEDNKQIQKTASLEKPKGLQNLHGLKKPIIQQTKQFSKPMLEQVKEIEWTTLFASRR